MPPEYSLGVLVSRMTWGSVRSAFSRKRLLRAHQQDAKLPRLGHHRLDDIVRVQVVSDVGDRLHHRPGLEGEGDDDVPLHLRIERDRLLADLLVVDRQDEREGDALVGEVGDRQERLIVESAVVGLPDRELRDADVLDPPPTVTHRTRRIRELPDLRRVERAVGQDVHPHPRIDGRDQREGRPDRLAQVVRLVMRLDVVDGARARSRSRVKLSRIVGLGSRLDDHHLGALARVRDQAGRLLLGLPDAARSDVSRLHGGRAVHHEDQPLRPLPLERQGRACQRGAQEEERQELEEQQGVQLEPLEER
jgi:hypothetical protein